jgi:tetratricopeptide (TPR) repeat protein
VAAAARLGDAVEETRALRNLAWALADLGRFDDAHTSLDTAMDRSPDDVMEQAWTHYHRDIVYAIQGRVAEALEAARRAHDLFEQVGDENGRAVALTDLGWHHGRLGDLTRALDLCEQALLLHQKLGNRTHEAHTVSCLAEIHLQLGDPAAAVLTYGQALDMFREFGDLYGEGSTLAHLGACHYVAGQHAAADDQWRHASTVLGNLDPSTIDQVHVQLATLDDAAAEAFRSAARRTSLPHDAPSI